MRIRKDTLGLDGLDELSAMEIAAAEWLSDELQRRLNQVGRSANSVQFIQALLARNIAAADYTLAWSELSSLVAALESLLAEQVAAGATLGAPSMPVTLIGEFDAANPFAVSYAQSNAARLIVEITNEQRALVRDLVTRAVRDGLTVDEVAAIVQRSIGLHDRWARAVNNRHDFILADMIERGFPMRTARAQAAAVAQTYHDELLYARARTIARTEILDAHNAGRWEGWADAVANGLVPTDATKSWSVRVPSRGDSPCPICLPIAGETVKWDEPFSVGVMMPPLHPNCVCTAVLVIGDSTEYLEPAM